MSMRTVLALLTVALTQVACGSLFGRNTSTAGMGPAQCRAAGARQFLGQELELHVADDARAHAGAMRSRVVRPGDAVTSGDVDPLRLTIELNEAGRIRRLRCG